MGKTVNLQFFAQERTEKATPRRRQKAREKGQVFSSRELNSALGLLASFLLLRIVGKNLCINAINFFYHILNDYINIETFNNEEITILFFEIIIFMGKALLPVLSAAFVVSLFSNYMQVGFVLTLDTISPKLERINPIEGFKRIFSRRSLVELIKSIIKMFVVGYVVYISIKTHISVFPLILDMGLLESIALTLDITFDIGIKACIALLIFSFFDYFYQWYEYNTGLMMSKQDIKEEFKEVEGNPQIKSRIRQIQRQMASRRMMTDVKKADVVITNPTHYAIALAYDAAIHSAPIVLAKGANELAKKIKKIANEEDIPIVENKALAQTLYKSVEVGGIIPESLYNAIAEILAFVYSLKERGI